MQNILSESVSVLVSALQQLLFTEFMHMPIGALALALITLIVSIRLGLLYPGAMTESFGVLVKGCFNYSNGRNGATQIEASCLSIAGFFCITNLAIITYGLTEVGPAFIFWAMLISIIASPLHRLDVSVASKYRDIKNGYGNTAVYIRSYFAKIGLEKFGTTIGHIVSFATLLLIAIYLIFLQTGYVQEITDSRNFDAYQYITKYIVTVFCCLAILFILYAPAIFKLSTMICPIALLLYSWILVRTVYLSDNTYQTIQLIFTSAVSSITSIQNLKHDLPICVGATFAINLIGTGISASIHSAVNNNRYVERGFISICELIFSSTIMIGLTGIAILNANMTHGHCNLEHINSIGVINNMLSNIDNAWRGKLLLSFALLSVFSTMVLLHTIHNSFIFIKDQRLARVATLLLLVLYSILIFMPIHTYETLGHITILNTLTIINGFVLLFFVRELKTDPAQKHR